MVVIEIGIEIGRIGQIGRIIRRTTSTFDRSAIKRLTPPECFHLSKS